MVTKPAREEFPLWAQEYLESRRPPTSKELRARKNALRGALRVRKRLDIRPLRIVDIIRSMRDDR
ncbi:MAG: hypothetical protein IIC91_12075 [Chloroflexi bacterium]|nr:hypothetical protein [Chloroflexota bacterium]MCH8009589.1 hypothetical protein [Chloroflexota bacterium]